MGSKAKYLAAETPLDYKSWKEVNRDELVIRFHKKFGSQMHEFQDFCEYEFAKFTRNQEKNSDPGCCP